MGGDDDWLVAPSDDAQPRSLVAASRAIGVGARGLTVFGVAAVLLAVAARAGPGVPEVRRELPLPVRPIESATCADAARIVGEAGAAGRRLRVTGRVKLHVAAIMPGDRTTFAIDCDDEHLVGSETPTGGEDLLMPPGSAFAAQVDRHGHLRVLGVCVSCTSPSFSDPGDESRGWRAIGVVLFLVGIVALALGLGRSGGEHRLRRAIEAAGLARAEPAPFLPERVLVRALGEKGARELGLPAALVASGGALVEGDERVAPRISLGATRGYREGAPSRPELVGPGRVNGVRVRAGERFPLASEDVVRLGDGAAHHISFTGADPGVVRFRANATGGVRVVRFAPANGPVDVALSLATGTAVVLAVPLLYGAPLALGLASVGVSVGLLAWTALRSPARKTPVVVTLPERVASATARRVSASATGDAGWEWLATAADGSRYLLESIPRASLFASAEERALRATLRREAELLSIEPEPGSDPPT